MNEPQLVVGSITFNPVPSQISALGAAIGKELRPELCRDRLRDEGLPHPKSGCQCCSDRLLRGCPHKHANDNYPRVVALTGAAGSGKSTAADYLIRQHGYERVKFAGPLKDMCRAIGMTESQIEGESKEEPAAMLSGKTPRHAMQTLGTEWGRKCMGEDFWTNLWLSRVKSILAFDGRVVVDDCRFPNEAEVVRKLGGVIVKLEGRGGIAGAHASEAGCGTHDVVVENDGCIVDLYAHVVEAVRRAG